MLIYIIGLRKQVSENEPLMSIVCFTIQSMQDIHRYPSTRRLGLERCVNRELQKYVAQSHTLNQKGYQMLDSNN